MSWFVAKTLYESVFFHFHTFRCEIGLPVDWNRSRMRNVCNFESHVYFVNIKCTFK